MKYQTLLSYDSGSDLCCMLQRAQLVCTLGGTQSQTGVMFKGFLTAPSKDKNAASGGYKILVTGNDQEKTIRQNISDRRYVSVGELNKQPSKSPSHSEISPLA